MSIRLIYETHAITEDNERGIATGWLPGELSQAGWDAARALGDRRRTSGISAVYVSDLRRAVQTAEIAFAGTDIPILQDWRLRECNYGRLNGAPVTQLESERRRRIDVSFPDGESCVQVVDRTRDFLSDLVRTRDDQTVLVIAHSANRWALENILCGTPLEELVEAPFQWRPGWEYMVETHHL